MGEGRGGRFSTCNVFLVLVLPSLQRNVCNKRNARYFLGAPPFRLRKTKFNSSIITAFPLSMPTLSFFVWIFWSLGSPALSPYLSELVGGLAHGLLPWFSV